MQRRRKVSKSGTAEDRGAEGVRKGASNDRHKARQTTAAGARIEAPKAPAAPRALGTIYFAKKCKISRHFAKMPDFVEISRNIVYFISTNLEEMYISSGSLIK